MTFDDRANLTQNGRVACRRTRLRHAGRRRQVRPMIVGALSILLAGLVFAPAAPASNTTQPPPASPRVEEAPVPPLERPPEIPPQLLQPAPTPGKGRVAFVIGGNRRWCTYPDDRLVRPPKKPGTFEKRNEVFTFGYQFTMSAVKRGQADVPLMLYESPIYHTASWIPAFKL